MAGQTTLNGPSLEQASTGVGENVANLTSDLLSLAELQGQLLLLDVREYTAKSAVPSVILSGGASLFLGTIPVALLGIVWCLAEQTSLSVEGAFSLVSGISLVIAVLAMSYGLYQVRQGLQILNRSRAELQENLRWMKKVMYQATKPVQS